MSCGSQSQRYKTSSSQSKRFKYVWIYPDCIRSGTFRIFLLDSCSSRLPGQQGSGAQKSVSVGQNKPHDRVLASKMSNYRACLLYTCSENQHFQYYCVVKQLIPKKALLSMYEMRFPEIYIWTVFQQTFTSIFTEDSQLVNQNSPVKQRHFTKHLQKFFININKKNGLSS